LFKELDTELTYTALKTPLENLEKISGTEFTNCTA